MEKVILFSKQFKPNGTQKLLNVLGEIPHNLSDNGLKHEVTIYVIEGHHVEPLGDVDATALGF